VIFVLHVMSFVFELLYQFLFYWILHTFIPLRKNCFMRILAFLVSHFFTSVVVYRNDLDNILLSLTAMILYLIIFHQSSIIEKMTAVFIFYPIMISMNFLTMDIASQIFFAVTKETVPGPGWDQDVVFFVINMGQRLVHLLFWCGIWIFLRKPLRQIRLDLTVKMWLIVDSIIMVSGIACFTTIYFSEEQSVIIYPLCIAAVFSSIGCVCLVAYMSNSMQNAYEVQRLKMQQTYYQNKQKEEERIRSVYHDMKNHLLVLERSQKSEDAHLMIQELRSQIADYEDYIHTGNDFLDIIIKDKAEYAREKHMEFFSSVDFEGIDFIEPLDISTLFGNGLDNAMEASEKLPREQRVILVKAGKIQDFVSILIENHCLKEKEKQVGRTSKRDFLFHGFGISNMEKAAGKYGGWLTVKNEDGKFVLKILIPIPASQKAV
jgi:hypothetical protein